METGSSLPPAEGDKNPVKGPRRREAVEP
jgi:hypothetical protein